MRIGEASRQYQCALEFDRTARNSGSFNDELLAEQQLVPARDELDRAWLAHQPQGRTS